MTEKVSVITTVDKIDEQFKELAADIICNAFHSEAEAFVAEFLDSNKLVLTASDEEKLIECACGFFANFGADGPAHKVLWNYLCRRLDERFPWKGVSHE